MGLRELGVGCKSRVVGEDSEHWGLVTCFPCTASGGCQPLEKSTLGAQAGPAGQDNNSPEWQMRW